MNNNVLPHKHGDNSKEIRLKMPEDSTFCTVSEILKMMSDNKRIQIFWILCHCEECVVNLSALVDMSSPAVSHHLRLLKESGFITSRRDGREVYYTAAKSSRAQALHDMIENLIEIECPDEKKFIKTQSYDSQIQTVNEIHDFITENLSVRYTTQELSSKFHINPTTLKSTFKALYGKPIGTYMREYRIQRAKELLSEGATVAQSAQKTGYENQSKFTEVFKKATGMLPKEYKKGL